MSERFTNLRKTEVTPGDLTPQQEAFASEILRDTDFTLSDYVDSNPPQQEASPTPKRPNIEGVLTNSQVNQTSESLDIDLAALEQTHFQSTLGSNTVSREIGPHDRLLYSQPMTPYQKELERKARNTKTNTKTTSAPSLLTRIKKLFS